MDNPTIYCLRTLPAPARCYHCDAQLEPGLSGFYYTRPLCLRCFSACEPVLAGVLETSPSPSTSLAVAANRTDRCIRCSRSIRSWLAGQRLEGIHCRRCLLEIEPALAAVLTLEEGARSLVEDEAPASQYLDLVRHYAAAQSKLAGS